jgi:hypothetical protein
VTPGTAAWNPAWYAATAIYWDPSALFGGSDSNTGLSPASPLLTFKKIVSNYGSPSPQFNYGQSVTITQMSLQPAGQDPVFFTPKVSGGGQAILYGEFAVFHSAFSAGTITPKSVSLVGGTGLQIAGMPAGTVAGYGIFNITRSSFAFILAMSGSTAAVNQPLTIGSYNATGGGSATEDNTWATGDSIEIVQVPSCNLKLWKPQGSADATNASQVGFGWVQFVQIADSSTVGESAYTLSSDGVPNILSGCLLNFLITDGTGFPVEAIGCMSQELAHLGGVASFIGGGVVGATNIDADGFSTYADATFAGIVTVGNNDYLASMSIGDGTAGQGVYFNGALVVDGGQVTVRNPIYGSASLRLDSNATYYDFNWPTNSFASQILLSGIISFNGVTVASAYDGTTGLWTTDIPLTPANLDTYGGLQDPQANCRFVGNSQTPTAPNFQQGQTVQALTSTTLGLGPTQNSFTYKPGTASTGNNYSDLVDAVAACNALGGAMCTIVIDDTFGTPTTQSLTYDFTDITLIGSRVRHPSNPVTLTVVPGTTFSNLWADIQFLEINNTANTPVYTAQTGDNLRIGFNTNLAGAATSVLIYVPTTATSVGLYVDSLATISQHGTIQVLGSGVLEVVAGPLSTIDANAFQGNGTINLFADPSASIGTQAILFTGTYNMAFIAPATTWGTNVAGVFPGAGAAAVFISKTVTPSFTGKYRVTISGTMINVSAMNNVAVSVGPSHGSGVTAMDFSGGAVARLASTGAVGSVVPFSVIVDYDQLSTPIIFPVGTAVTFNAVVQVSGGGPNIGVSDSCQLEVTERLA